MGRTITTEELFGSAPPSQPPQKSGTPALPAQPSLEILQGENGAQPTVLPADELQRQNSKAGKKKIISSEEMFGAPAPKTSPTGKKIISSQDLFGTDKPPTQIDIKPEHVDDGLRKANFLENMVWKNWAGIPEDKIEEIINRHPAPQEQIAKILLGPLAAAIPGKTGQSARETLFLGLAPLAEAGNRFIERPLASVAVPLAKLAFLGIPLEENEFPKLIQDIAPNFAADPKNKQEYAMLRNLMNAYFTVKPQEMEDIKGYKFGKERPEFGDIFRARNIAMGMPPALGEPLAALGGLALRFLLPDVTEGAAKLTSKTGEVVNEAAQATGAAVKGAAEEIPGAVKAGVKEAGEAIKTTVKGTGQTVADSINEAYNFFKGRTDKQTFIKQMVDKGYTRAQSKQLFTAFDEFIKANGPQKSIEPDYIFRQITGGIESPTAMHSTIQEKGVQADDLKSVVDTARENVAQMEQAAENLTKQGKPVPAKLTEAIEKIKQSVPMPEAGRGKGAGADTEEKDLNKKYDAEDISFEVTLDSGKKVGVAYDPKSFNGTAHFGFHGESISETGYHSVFATMEKGAKPEEAAKRLAEGLEKTYEKAKPGIEKAKAKRAKDLKNDPHTKITPETEKAIADITAGVPDVKKTESDYWVQLEAEHKGFTIKTSVRKSDAYRRGATNRDWDVEQGEDSYSAPNFETLQEVKDWIDEDGPEVLTVGEVESGSMEMIKSTIAHLESKASLSDKEKRVLASAKNQINIRKELGVEEPDENHSFNDALEGELPVELNEREAIMSDGSILRRTPPGQPTVKDLVSEGDIIESYRYDWNDEGTARKRSEPTVYRVEHVSEHIEHGIPHYSLSLSELDANRKADGKLPENYSYAGLNDLTAQDGKIISVHADDQDYVQVIQKAAKKEAKAEEPAKAAAPKEKKKVISTEEMMGKIEAAKPPAADTVVDPALAKVISDAGMSNPRRQPGYKKKDGTMTEGLIVFDDPYTKSTLGMKPSEINKQSLDVKITDSRFKFDSMKPEREANEKKAELERLEEIAGEYKTAQEFIDAFAKERTRRESLGPAAKGQEEFTKLHSSEETKKELEKRLKENGFSSVEEFHKKSREKAVKRGTIKQEGKPDEGAPKSTAEGSAGRKAPGTGGVPADQSERDAGDVGPSEPSVQQQGSARPDSEGRGRVPEESSKRKVPKAAEPVKEFDANYKFTPADEEAVSSGTPKKKYQDNLYAIQTLKKIESENREATPEEQAVLVKYAGWGGLAQAFDPKNKTWQKEYAELKAALSEKEYNNARASTVNAHYTSPTVIKAMWSAVKRLGFKSGRVLEPGMGTGNFLGLRPAGKISFAGVELDGLTGRIAKQLYQSADIHIGGFEDTNLSQNFYDLAISNVPFASTQPVDRRAKELGIPTGLSLHDFFFAKSLALVRPGGIVAFITSRYTMDKQAKTVRELLSKKADFLGAIRLPNNAFKANAGTEVVTDIVFLRKRNEGETEKSKPWIESPVKPIGNAEANVNEYFANNPSMILGEEAITSGLYSDTEYTVRANGDLTEQLAAAIGKLPKNVLREAAEEQKKREEVRIKEDVPERLKEDSHFERDGKIYQKINDTEAKEVNFGADAARVKALIKLRDSMKRLLHDQQLDAPDGLIEQQQKALNKEYDQFVKKYGLVNDRKNQTVFGDDPDIYFISAQEELDKKTNTYKKAAIFSQRIIRPYAPVLSVKTAKEGMLVSLNEFGEVNIPHIAKISSRTPEEVVRELSAEGVIYKNPETELYETKDEYLSGNVKAKLVTAKKAAEADKAYQTNVEALQAVIPEDKPFHRIQVRIGSPWIPNTDYAEFLEQLLDEPGRVDVEHGPASASWSVEFRGYSRNNIITYGIDRKGFKAVEIFEKIANHKDLSVFDTTEDDKKILNEQATADVREKAAIIKEKFAEWIWKDMKRRERLAKYFNDHFNNIVTRKHDGSHLTFPGMNPTIKLRPSQINAIWRAIQTKKVMFAHAVGSGKTFTMIASGMEMKRLGLIQKPMYAVLNSTVRQFAADFRKLYPGANILVADEKNFSAEKRESFLAKIATRDIDGIIITHSAFGRINIGKETYENYIQDRVGDLREFIQRAGNNPYQRKSKSVKDAENAVKKLTDRIKAKIDESTKDKTLSFEELGVDQLFVDEVQEFKNLMYQTQMTRVAGLGSKEGSDKSEDMAIKIGHMMRVNNGKGVIFSTGTPILNTLAEAYTMMRFLQPDALKELGITHFDDWANQFGETVSQLEVRPSGKGFRMNNRFSRVINANELMKILRQVWDIYTAKMLEDDGILRRGHELPFIKGGQAESTIAPMTPTLRRYIDVLDKRYNAALGKKPEKGADNVLVVVGDGRKAAVDIRIVVPGGEDNKESKLNMMISGVHEIWAQNKKNRLTQVIFFDLAKPKKSSEAMTEEEEEDIESQDASNTGFDPYEDMMRKWTKLGIPQSEIAFINDAKNNKQKQAIFEKVKAGEVRILVGSTQKMGIGANFQDRLLAAWNLDTPWRPGDLTQRVGRIMRQGNQNKEIMIFNMATKGSFDVYMWQTLQSKAEALESMMSSDEIDDVIEDDSHEFDMIKAKAADNPILMEKVQTDSEVKRLQSLRRAYLSRKDEEERFLAGFEDRLTATKVDLKDAEERKAKLPKERPTAENKLFKMTVNDTEYTDKKSAGAALMTNFEAVMFGKVERMAAKTGAKIGEFMGYTLIPATSPSTGTAYVKIFHKKSLIGDVQYAGSPEGLVQAIVNRVFDSPDDEIQYGNRRLASLEKEKRAVDTEGVGEFKYEKDLQAMTAKQRDLDKQLREMALQKQDDREAPEVEAEIQQETKPETDELLDGGTTLASFPGNIFLHAEKRSQAEKQKEAEARARDEVATVTFSDPEIEKRFKAANGMDTKEKLVDSVKEFFANAKKQLRVHPELPNKPEYAFLKNLLRKQNETRAVANDRAVRSINAITATFGPKKLDLFTRKVILDDLVREAEAGRAVPYGYSYTDEATGAIVTRIEVLKQDKEKIDALVEGNPDIKEAIQRRQRLWAAIQADLVRYKILKASQLKEDYFRHQVLEFARAKATYGTGTKLRSPSPGYSKRREGSTFDINSSYLEAEFEVMAQSFADIETARALEEIELSPLNLMKDLKQKAKEANDKEIREYFAKLIEAEKARGNPKFMFKTVDELYKETLNWKQAIGLSKLGKLAADGDLPTGDHGEYEDFVSDMAEHYEDGDAEIDNGLLFKYLNYLMKTGGEEGSPASKAAATVFKGIAEKKAFIIETLGDRFKTWRDFIPETHTTWQPKEGRVFYSSYSVPQRIVNEVLSNVEPELGEFSITKNDLKKIMAVGGPRKELVLPQEVADTLDNLYQVKPPNWLFESAKALTTAWKKWVLFNPRRFFKYNFQNFLGDADAVIAGQPKIFKNLGRAQKELTDVFYKNQPMTKEMREFFERGGLASTLTVQEIPDIKKLEIFSRFFSEAEKAKDANAATKIMRKYWENAVMFTTYRESLLRYAAYLHYRDVFMNGGKEYAASDPIEVDGIQDPMDKAAKVATELLGDYANVSALTKNAREAVIPFASWLEVNLKRYYRLTKNSFMTGGAGAGAGTAGRISAVALRKGASGMAKFFLRAAAMTILAGLYNQLFWADEEENISPYDQNRMHLIVGRTKDGRIIILRGQGAFSDALEWFGLDQAPQLLREYFEGKSSWEDVFGKVPFIYGGGIGLKPVAQKVLRGINPLYKWPFEVATGRTLPVFDDRPGKIEDPVRYILQGLQLENEYDLLLRKPSRGYGQSLIESFVAVQDPEENAYRYIQSQKYEYLEKWKGRGGAGDFYSPNSILYRELKRAIRFGDKDAEARINEKIKEKGLTNKQVNQSLDAADPLYGLNKADKQEFIEKYLSKRDRMKYDRAMTYFEKTFKK